MPASSPGFVNSTAEKGEIRAARSQARDTGRVRVRIPPSQDELRLCGDFSLPADAVPIQRPGQDDMHPRFDGGSFRPINTLSQNPGSRNGFSNGRMATKHVSAPVLRRSDFGNGSPDNVFEREQRPVKRRKVLAEIDTPSSQTVEEIDIVSADADDDEDVLDFHKYSRASPDMNIPSPKRSGTSSQERRRHAGFAIDEYRAVEGRMAHKPKKGRLGKRVEVVDLLSQSGVGPSNLPDRPALGNGPDKPVEVSDDEDSPKKPAQAARDASGGKRGHILDTKERSENSASGSGPALSDAQGDDLTDAVTYTGGRSTHKSTKSEIITGTHPTDSQHNLRDVFRREPKRRPVETPGSPDELAGYNKTELAKQEGRVSRSSDDGVRAEGLRSKLDTEYRSDIKATQFSRSGSSSTHRAPPKARAKSKKGNVSQCWPLRTFRSHGLELVDDSVNYALRFDPGEEVLLVFLGGIPAHRIDPGTVISLNHSADSSKVRLSARGAFASDPTVDMDFCERTDVTSFVRFMKLTNQTIKVEEITAEKLDQKFAKKKNDLAASQASERSVKGPEATVAPQESMMHGAKTHKKHEILQGPEVQKGPAAFISDLRAHADPADSARHKSNSKSFRSTSPLSANLDPQVLPRRSTRSSNGAAPARSEERRDTMNDVPFQDRFSVKYGLGDPWERSLTYPAEGKKKTSVDFEDLLRLDEGEFLNDNIIAFYLRYIEDEMERKDPSLAKRVYFFNTFFYPTLTSNSKGRKGVNYAAVQRWTRTVDLFTYDFIVVPVNGNYHWYLALICNLPQLKRTLEAGDDDLMRPEERSEPEKLPENTTGVPSASDHGPYDMLQSSPNSSGSDREIAATGEKVAKMSIGQDVAAGSGNSSVDDLRRDRMEGMAEEASNPGQSPSDGRESGLVDQVGELSERASEPARDIVESSRYFDTGDAKSDSVANGITASTIGKFASLFKKGRKKAPPPAKKYDPSEPVIITLDSLDTSHSQTVRVLKDYLREEGKAKRHMDFPVDEIKGMTAKQIATQTNFCDCGVYLLGYMEKFKEDPRDFVTKILQRQYDKERDWGNLQPGKMRNMLRELLQKLYNEQKEARRRKLRESGKLRPRKEQNRMSSPDASSRAREVELSDSDALPVGSTRARALQEALPIDVKSIEGQANQRGNLSLQSRRLPRYEHAIEGNHPQKERVTIDVDDSQDSMLLDKEERRTVDKEPTKPEECEDDVVSDTPPRSRSPTPKRSRVPGTNREVLKNPSVVV